jgi:hypothetical protein
MSCQCWQSADGMYAACAAENWSLIFSASGILVPTRSRASYCKYSTPSIENPNFVSCHPGSRLQQHSRILQLVL